MTDITTGLSADWYISCYANWRISCYANWQELKGQLAYQLAFSSPVGDTPRQLTSSQTAEVASSVGKCSFHLFIYAAEVEVVVVISLPIIISKNKQISLFSFVCFFHSSSDWCNSWHVSRCVNTFCITYRSFLHYFWFALNDFKNRGLWPANELARADVVLPNITGAAERQ